MILRNPTSMNFLKNKMSPNGEILVHIHTMTFLATREMHYVVNPKHDWLIGTVLLFATEKAKRKADH